MSAQPGEAAAADSRRERMLQAALEVITERGFPETRIGDVARRAGVSPALVIYYFKTKDRLLTEALRYSEDSWYEEGTARMRGVDSAAGRLEQLVSLTCLPEGDGPATASWSLWLDLWAQAVRHPEVAEVRREFDERWRGLIRRIVTDGQRGGEFRAVDPTEFAVTMTALLDGLAVQIALGDPAVDGQRAYRLSMAYAADRLGFERPARRRQAARGDAGRRAGPGRRPARRPAS